MKKLFGLIFLSLILNTLTVAEDKISYLSDLDKCEKQNKKMGDLAWKQCANKIQYYNMFAFASGSANFIHQRANLLTTLESDDDKVTFFKVKIKNVNSNFVITKINGFRISIPGKEEIVIDSDFVKIFPNSHNQYTKLTTPCPFTQSAVITHCLYIDLSKYNLVRSDIRKKWSWNMGTIFGVKMVEKKDKLFNSKIYFSDIDKCVRRSVGKYQVFEDNFTEACTYEYSQKLDNKLIKFNRTLKHKTDSNNDLSNYLQYEIKNEISNDFMITRFSMDIEYDGDNCKGKYYISKKKNIEPGSSIDLESKIEKGSRFINVPCKKVNSLSVDLTTWGVYY